MLLTHTLASKSFAIIALALTLGGGLGVARAQECEPCALTAEQAPGIRGLKLGMAFEQLQKLYPLKLDWRAAQLGARSEKLTPPEGHGAGVNYLDVVFLDDRLVSVSVAYSSSATFKSGQDFADRVTAGLGLPHARRAPPGAEYALTCAGFMILIDSSGLMPLVRLSIPGAEETIKKRRADYEEEQRQRFKP